MKARKIVIFVLLAILILSTLACGGGGEGEGDDDGVTEIKIGLGLPLSGMMGAYIGGPAKQAYELMADRIGVFEVGGKQYRWKPIFEDNEGGTSSGGMASTTRFIYDHNVDFVLQSGAAAIASQALCKERAVIMDMGTAPFDAFGSEHPYTTQSGPCLTVLVAAFYDWLAEEHPEVERIVIVSLRDPITIAYTEAFESNMHEYFGFECEIVPLDMATTEYYPVATAAMTKDPDLVIAAAAIIDLMRDMGYEGLGVQFGPLLDQAFLEQAGWDDSRGLLLFYPEWYGAEEVWPEGVACAEEYESRYSVEMGTTTFAACMNLLPLTGALQQAGTVDDTEKIMEVIQSRTTFDSIVGPVYYGGEAFVGTNCLLMWPVAIWEVVGEREYELLHYYTPEEAEAIAVEAWTATMQ
jgi:ABC-type branched-subunit amino acid transport system substrate-binding protein